MSVSFEPGHHPRLCHLQRYYPFVRFRVSTSDLKSFAKLTAMSVGFTTVTGAVGHIISAHFAPDLYDIAVGCGALPEQPWFSWSLAPLLVGIYVNWWVGLVAAPIVYAFAGGSRADLRPVRLVVAGTTGMATSAIWVLGGAMLDPEWPEWGGYSLLRSLLDHGYVALSIGLAVMALLLRRRGTLPVAEDSTA